MPKQKILKSISFFQNLAISIKFIGVKSIILNSSVWPEWLGTGVGKVNFGDDLNVPLVEHLSGKKVRLFNTLLCKSKKENLLAIGSIVENFCNEESVIWGSGAMYGDRPLQHKPRNVLAVRGKLTRDYLLSQGLECPEVYGDPALLFPTFYRPSVEKKYKLGVIPHYQDFNLPHIKSFRDSHPDVLFIQLQGYTSWQDIINQICSCERIVSSSLHGMILSDAYGIPNVHMACSDSIEGGDFKYKDYISGVGREYRQPINCKETVDIEEIENELALYKPINFNPQALLDAFPYKAYQICDNNTLIS